MKRTKIFLLLLIVLIPALSFAGVTRKVVERYPPLSSDKSASPDKTALPGNPKTVVYSDSKGKEIARELCDETGAIVKTSGKIPDGTVKEYFENGAVLADYNYKDGKLEGKSKGYYPNGTLRGEWNYKNGKLEGVIKAYYQSGKLNYEFNFKNDMRNGTSKYYSEDGKLSYEWNYKDEKLEGISKGYYESGQLRVEYNYKDGERDGESKTYYQNGKLRFLGIYKNGTMISKTAYDDKGAIISTKGSSNTSDHSGEEKKVE